MSKKDTEVTQTSAETMQSFWERVASFHDEEIEGIVFKKKKAIFELSSYWLVCTEIELLEKCEIPCTWLYQSLIVAKTGYTLTVETDTGRIVLKGKEFRVIRQEDVAILVPQIDKWK